MITIPLDNTDLKPFYIQIYEYIRKEILNGNIAAEEKLPSARNLAANLNVSRSTVDTAYDQLVAEGLSLIHIYMKCVTEIHKLLCFLTAGS